MNRREFITLLCAVAAACDLAPRRGRAASRGGIDHASDPPTMVREIVRVRPAAVARVALAPHGAILKQSCLRFNGNRRKAMSIQTRTILAIASWLALSGSPQHRPLHSPV